MRYSLCAVTLVLAVLLPQTLRAAPIFTTAFLDGPSEAPPNASPGTGFAKVVLDLTAHTLSVDFSFADLIGTTTAVHIHGPVAPPGTAGVITAVPTFPGTPLGVTSGTYSMDFDTTDVATYNPAFVAANGGTPGGAEAALAAALAAGETYLNIHTTVFGGGEIRGFLQPVPEPASLALFGIGALGAAVLIRRQRLATRR